MKKFAVAAAALALFAPAVNAKSDSNPAPTAAQIKAVLEANPDIVLDVLSQNKEKFFSIVKQAAQEDQERQAKNQAEEDQKRIAEAIAHPLKADIGPNDLVRGSKRAKYTLVEYADFQCPYCARALPTVQALRRQYGKNMRFVFKVMPLVDIHPYALISAKYFEAISLQSKEKAWKYYDKIFADQTQLDSQGEAFCKQVAQSLGVDMTRLEKDVAGPEVAKLIGDNTAEFKKLGFQGTPGFLVNGVPVFGAYPLDYFQNIIQKIDAAKKG
ncbi:MAG: thioredoxin domain-containing protein [Elusimicrobia bacterium]|nr:thioredoxin domain-containing protein [Elusimicrobiota bacterium]MDE2314560.1 thioredoxin domain-containing protein [Elusimicrobiota bacterium]